MASLDTAWGSQTYDVAGSGPPIVLLHPLALAGRFWAPVARHLSATRTVFTPDARGHGDSRWDGSEFGVEDLAGDIAQIIEQAADGPVTLAGASMGGCVALTLAVRRPDLVSQLLLIDTTADYGPDKVANWAARAESAVSTPRPEQLGFQIPRWFTDEFQESDPAEVRRVCDIFVATDSAAHAAASLALGGFGLSAELGGVSAPTRVVVGEDDAATPVSTATALHEGIRGSELLVIPRVRHFGILESAARWNEIFALPG
jgi:3-oxoadipate enol-lactonase